MLTLLRNISQTSIPDPFAFLDYYVTFLYRPLPVLPFRISIVYHFDEIASWSFEPALTYKDTNISTTIPENTTTWTIGVMTIPELITRGYSIYRGHPYDTIERRRPAVEQFTDRQWKYFSGGPPEYHVYPDPPPPPSQPPTISDVIVTTSSSSINVSYSVADDVEIQSVYAELLDNNYTLIELKQAGDLPTAAISYAAAFEFTNLVLGNSYIVKLYGVDTNYNITAQEQYVELTDTTTPTINMFTTTSHVPGHIAVDVNITDDSGEVPFASVSLYWIFDLSNELYYYYIELIDGVGSVTFTDLDPERTYIVELFVRDSSWNYGYANREGYPNGMGVVVSE